jgi:hypothetical protein
MDPLTPCPYRKVGMPVFERSSLESSGHPKPFASQCFKVCSSSARGGLLSIHSNRETGLASPN